MTDRLPQSSAATPRAGTGATAARSRRRPRFLPTVAASLAVFAVLFEFLAFQLRSGNDPALGAGTPVAAVRHERPVLVDRKIVKRRVVHLPPKQQSTSSTAVAAPATTATAPAPAAAPAPVAPAPAPVAPAPVTSSS